MPESEDKRNRSIRLAVITAILSKFGAVILRLVSIPIVIRELGMDQFGVYATITIVVGMIDMFHVGIGPALTKGISEALAKNDREKERDLFVTGFLLNLGLTLIIAGIVGGVLATASIPQLFGEKFAPFAETMHRACWIGLIIISVEIICVVCEKARDGYLETNISNSWGAFGNILGAISLLVGIWFFPTIEFLIIAINGSIVVGKIGNTIQLFVKRRYLWPRFSRFRKNLIKPLAFDGFRFSITYVLSALVEYSAIAYLIGRAAGPEAVGVYQVMITIHYSLTSVVLMLTTPMWPALMDAHARGHTEWIRRAARKLRILCSAFGLLAGVGLIVFGLWILPLWVGEDFLKEVPKNYQITRLTMVAFSGWFLLHIWRHVNQVLLLGMGKINTTLCTIIIEATLVFTLAGLTVFEGGSLTRIYGAMTLCIALVSGWVFPMALFRALKDSRSGSDAPPSIPVDSAS